MVSFLVRLENQSCTNTLVRISLWKSKWSLMQRSLFIMRKLQRMSLRIQSRWLSFKLSLPRMKPFYHIFWEISCNDITNLALNILNNNDDSTCLNKTFIYLIPIIKKPISLFLCNLCNVISKIVTKTIANRIKTILLDIISYNQSAFVSGIFIYTMLQLLMRVLSIWRTITIRKRSCRIKTDMVKAYTTIEWNILHKTLNYVGFLAISSILLCDVGLQFPSQFLLMEAFPKVST